MNKNSDPITIVIVDDVPVYRTALSNVLKSKYPNCTIIEEENGNQIVEVCQRVEPDIVITDLKMPGKDGFQVVNDLFNININYPVMVLTAYATIKALEKVTWAGCLGFVDKSSGMKVILEGVETVMSNKPYYSPFIHRLIQEHFSETTEKGGKT